MVGWVERSETQLSLGNLENVGFHSSTQPTVIVIGGVLRLPVI